MTPVLESIRWEKPIQNTDIKQLNNMIIHESFNQFIKKPYHYHINAFRRHIMS